LYSIWTESSAMPQSMGKSSERGKRRPLEASGLLMAALASARQSGQR
jgi:hypothetical protein